MSGQVRINLLPPEVGQKNAARRTQGLIGLAGLGVLALLAVGYMWQVGQVNDAQVVLDEENAKVAALQGEVRELSEFRRLADQGASVDAMITAMLGGEASFAGILQDLAAVMPSDANISSLAVSITPTGASATSSGVSLLGHAPGLERLLIAMDKVASFEDVFFTTSTIDASGIASFAFTFDLTELIFTGRYAGGLPEVMR